MLYDKKDGWVFTTFGEPRPCWSLPSAPLLTLSSLEHSTVNEINKGQPQQRGAGEQAAALRTPLTQVPELAVGGTGCGPMSKRQPCLSEHQLRRRACRGAYSSTDHPLASTGEPWVPPTAGTGCVVVVAAHHAHPSFPGRPKERCHLLKSSRILAYEEENSQLRSHFWSLPSGSTLLSPHIWYQLTGPGRGTEPSSGAAQGWLWGWLLQWWTGSLEQTPNLPLFSALQCPPLLNQESNTKNCGGNAHLRGPPMSGT